MKIFARPAAILICTLLTITASAKSPKTGIVAHRGFWNCEEAGYAKNSIAALRCAQKAGFWGSEFDVNMTSDEVLLVFHDNHVEGVSIEANPYSTFKDYKLLNGERIPTIDEYLQQGKLYPETMLVYELKKHSCEEVEDRFTDLSIEKLREHGLLDPDRVMFISFSYHICQRLAKKLPGFTVQFLSGDRTPEDVRKDGISGIDYKHLILRENISWISEAHRLGMSVNTWTVNNIEDIRFMLDSGIDQLTTDNPLEARGIIKELGIIELH